MLSTHWYFHFIHHSSGWAMGSVVLLVEELEEQAGGIDVRVSDPCQSGNISALPRLVSKLSISSSQSGDSLPQQAYLVRIARLWRRQRPFHLRRPNSLFAEGTAVARRGVIKQTAVALYNFHRPLVGHSSEVKCVKGGHDE